jgi:hypothetical protein
VKCSATAGGMRVQLLPRHVPVMFNGQDESVPERADIYDLASRAHREPRPRGGPPGSLALIGASPGVGSGLLRWFIRPPRSWSAEMARLIVGRETGVISGDIRLDSFLRRYFKVTVSDSCNASTGCRRRIPG